MLDWNGRRSVKPMRYAQVGSIPTPLTNLSQRRNNARQERDKGAFRYGRLRKLPGVVYGKGRPAPGEIEMSVDKYLDEVEKRAEETTEGPWYLQGHATDRFPGCYVVAREDSDLWVGDVRKLEDAAFLAQARQDIPRLLRIVRRLREGFDDLSHGYGIRKAERIIKSCLSYDGQDSPAALRHSAEAGKKT